MKSREAPIGRNACMSAGFWQENCIQVFQGVLRKPIGHVCTSLSQNLFWTCVEVGLLCFLDGCPALLFPMRCCPKCSVRLGQNREWHHGYEKSSNPFTSLLRVVQRLVLPCCFWSPLHILATGALGVEAGLCLGLFVIPFACMAVSPSKVSSTTDWWLVANKEYNPT